MNEREKVTLAALLHDIGKFRQRAKGDGIRHEEHSKIFLEQLYGDEDLAWLAYGHSSRTVKEVPENLKNMAKIVSDADSLSASERFYGKYEDKRDYTKQPLLAIPSIVRIGKGNSDVRYFSCHPLTLDPFPLTPKIKGGASVDYRFWHEFEQILSELKITSVEEYLFTLLNILHKYTFFIPSDTGWKEKEEYNIVPDVSLYEHLRTTSAFASALYDFIHEGGEGEKQFCLIWGDISGLQDFVFTLTSEKALKALKGRSVFLQFLLKASANKILRRLNLFPTNLLSCDAGEFTILAPNIDRVKEEVEKIRAEVNRELLKEYDGEIYLALGIHEFGEEEIKNIAEVFHKAKEEKVNLRKKRKWAELLPKSYSEVFIPEPKPGDTCVVCKRVGKIDEEGKCEICRGLEEFAKHLRNVEYVVEIDLSKGELPETKRTEIEKTGFYKEIFDTGFFILESKKELNSLLTFLSGYPVFIYRINDTDFFDPELKAGQGFMFMATHAPQEEGEIKDFDKIAEASKGAKRLGILRMDVDSLGDIFRRGINGWEWWRKDEGNSLRRLRDKESVVTPSRFATLSSLFNLFFLYIVDEICKKGGFFTSYKDDERAWDALGDAYVIYSGGDDLFIVGSWSKIFELYFKIREEFDIFFCNNPNITASGALIEVPRKFPVYRSAQLTMELLKDAKEEHEPEKNALSIFGKAKRWKNLQLCYNLKEAIYENIETNGGFLPRNFLFDLYDIHRTADEKAISTAKRKLFYQIARYKERYGHESELESLQKLITENLKNDLDIPVRWVELLTSLE